MTIQELFAKVAARKPHSYDEELLIDFVNEAEGLVYSEIIRSKFEPFSLPDGLNKELMAKSPYDKLYIHYLMAQIDILNEEFDVSNNHTELFNNAFDRYAKYLKSFFARQNGELPDIKGPKGDPGIPGDRGPQGIKGDTGEQGLQGERGVQGPQGIQGERGPQGLQGEQGIQGERGIQGSQGLKGDKGEIGPQGPQGIQGIPGVQGPKGDKGDAGVQGPKGDKGDTGAQGPVGSVDTSEVDIMIESHNINSYAHPDMIGYLSDLTDGGTTIVDAINSHSTKIKALQSAPGLTQTINPFTFKNNWALFYGNTNIIKIGNVCTINCSIDGGAVTMGTDIITLPTTCRPSKTLIVAVPVGESIKNIMVSGSTMTLMSAIPASTPIFLNFSWIV